MITGLIEKLKGFILDPACMFRQSKDEEPGTVLPYFLLLLIIDAVLTALLSMVMNGTSPVPGPAGGGIYSPVLIFFMVLAAGFAGTLFFGAWLHLWIYVFGGRRGIWQTVKAVMYGSTPSLLLGWIPFIGFFFTLWSLVLVIIGIHELQEITPIKAILTVALAVMIPLIILLILAAFFMIASVTTTSVPVPVVGLS